MFSHKGLCVADHLRPSVFETALVIASHSDASLTRCKIPRFKVQYLELRYSRWFPKTIAPLSSCRQCCYRKAWCQSVCRPLSVSNSLQFVETATSWSINFFLTLFSVLWTFAIRALSSLILELYLYYFPSVLIISSYSYYWWSIYYILINIDFLFNKSTYK